MVGGKAAANRTFGVATSAKIVPFLPRLWEGSVLLLAAGIGAFLLFVPPIIGLADQRDFGRVMEGVGLIYPGGLPEAQRYFCFLQTTYRIVPLHTPPFLSSESFFVIAARVLNRATGHLRFFDIRMLGLVHLLAFLGAIYLLLRCGRDLNAGARIIFAVLILLAACDVGYISYFNSFYLEPATYLFGLTFIAAVITLVLSPAPTRLHLAFVFGSLVLFVGAKPQNLPVLLTAVPFLTLSLRRITPRSTNWNVTWILGDLLICAALASAFLLGPISTVRSVNLYNSIFLQALPGSPSPGDDLAALGLDPVLARYSGTSAFDTGVPFYNPALFPQHASYGRLLAFYLLRPARLLGLTGRGIQAALSNRDTMLGNYERSSGRPCQTLSLAFGMWDAARKHLRNLWVIGAFLLLNIIGPSLLSRRAGNARASVLLQFHASMALAAGLLFYAAILADGNEFQKHLFPFNFLFDCCLVADALWAAQRFGLIAAPVRGWGRSI